MGGKKNYNNVLIIAYLEIIKSILLVGLDILTTLTPTINKIFYKLNHCFGKLHKKRG